jgi:hypothetical protein
LNVEAAIAICQLNIRWLCAQGQLIGGPLSVF